MCQLMDNVGWLLGHWRKAVPVLISAGLVSWVVWRVSPERLVSAAAELDWPWMAALTAAMVLGLYFWDAVCLRWFFAQPDFRLSYADSLRARGTSYLAIVFNYQLGQGILAWRMARASGAAVWFSLGRCLLLAYHDMGVLLALGVLGAALSTHPGAGWIRWIAGGVLLGMIVLAVSIGRLPDRWQQRLQATKFGAGLTGWSWDRSLRLCLLRGGYYLILLAYAAAGLPLCGLAPDYRVVFSVVPLVLLADGLPISVSGLGTRETTLQLLLNPGEHLRGALLAFSLFWSSGLILGRSLIGLVNLWWEAGNRRPEIERQVGEMEKLETRN